MPKGEILPFNCYLNGKPICVNMGSSKIIGFIEDHYDIHVGSNDIIQVANGTGVSSKGFYFEYAYDRLRKLLNKRERRII